MRLRLVFLLPLLLLAAVLHAEQTNRSSEELSPALKRMIAEAISAYKQEDFPKALKLLNEVDAIQPGTLAALNLRGAIKLDQGDIKEAGKLFQEAHEKDPAFYPAKYNLAEIPFQEKDYDKAREMFEKLLRENPADELAQFKIFLSYLLQRNMEQAKEKLEALTWPGDTPAYYFSHAAWEYAHRNVEEAEGWIASASRIFSPNANAIYAQTLQELGWLKLRGEQKAEPGADVPEE